jgi:hypothetical protein
MAKYFRIILISLICINSLGYDWVHTFWHYRNDPQRVLPAIRFHHDGGGAVIACDVSFVPDFVVVKASALFAAEKDDRLTNTSQPFKTDLKSVKFLCFDQPMVVQYAPLLGNQPPDPGTPGFHSSIFRPPRTAGSFG